MRYAAKWFGLVAVTVAMAPFAEIPALLTAAALAQEFEAPRVEATEPFQLSIRAKEGASDAFGATHQLDERSGNITLRQGDDGPDSVRLVNTHQFEGKAGQTITIQVKSRDFAPWILVTHASTNTLVGSGLVTLISAEDAWLVASLPADGTYSIRVTTHNENGQGSYQMRVANSTEAEIFISDAVTLSQRGGEQYSTGDFAAALQTYRQALIRKQAFGFTDGGAVPETLLAISRREEARILLMTGNTHEALGDYDQAIDLQQQAIALRRQLQDQSGVATALTALGNTHSRQQNREEAIAAYEEALEIWQVLDNRAETEHLLDRLGSLYSVTSQIQSAIDVFEQSLAIKRANDDRSGEAEILRYLGIAHRTLSNYPQAIDFHQQSLTVARAIPDRTQEAAALGNLGVSYRAFGNPSQALNWHYQALEIYTEINDINGQSNAFDSIAISQFALGQYQRAIGSYQQALTLAREANDNSGVRRTTNNLGFLYQTLGRDEQAFELYEQSLNLARELQDRSSEAMALRNLAAVHPNYFRRIELLNQSIEIANGLDEPLALIRAWVDIGRWYLANPRTLGVSEGALRVDWRYPEILGLYQRALTLAQQRSLRAEEATILINLGSVYRSMHSFLPQEAIAQDAVAAYEQSLAIHRERGNQAGEQESLYGLALIHMNLGQHTQAEQYLLSALDISDRLREGDLNDTDKLALFEIQRGGYATLQRTLIEQGRIEDALVASERGRARVLVETLANHISTSAEQDLLDTVPNLSQIRRIAQQQNVTLVSYSRPQEADRLYIWVVQPTGEIAFESVALASERNIAVETEAGNIELRTQPSTGVRLQDLVITARDAIGVRGDRATIVPEPTPEYLAQQQARTEANLRQLYDLLIAPIADLLPADPKQPVVFMPQEELFLVPFAALKAPDGSYLIENHTILTAPSIQVFGLATEARSAAATANGGSLFSTDNALIVGNPTMPTVTFLSESGTFQDMRLSPLPGAQREAEAISGFLQTPALLGSAATKVAVQQRMAGADVIHLATHGLLEYGDPRETGTRDLPGAIALAPGSGDNGLLTSAEILAMDLQANLAILSACDTGRGRITGDGVVGLSRAFVAAGVPSIIVSLWAVDDAATADLMVAFYDNWQQSGDKAQALRQAMLTTMAQHPDPRLWAAFTLIGSAD
ncbi:MAG: CHAT domain-containing protein [Kaiparowitsia implicata GSE-PSE-MK54-09C]|jgi:CHAT domain-containing protein/tetratricopeptide (TPR) repeat protein|nr:CHAT domain-containing protein [Kaiparowitsia implicata GSE-PSE-MK54-09C]